MTQSYLTEEVKALIGVQSPWIEAPHVVEPSEVRRFYQAVMDFSPRYRGEHGAADKYGGPVAPPAFAVHAFRRRPEDQADPIAETGDPDFDGFSRALRPGLPTLPVPLSGVLNGGYEYEFYSFPKHGERILCRSVYRDVYQKEGKSGVMVFAVVEDEYKTADGRPLLKSLNTMIMR